MTDKQLSQMAQETEIESRMNMDRLRELVQDNGAQFVNYEGIEFNKSGAFARCMAFSKEQGAHIAKISVEIDGLLN